jgi:uncharacterized coiled-coil protein SlyX
MKPKLPKLHLRDLFWLVLVAALGCGWWLDRSRMAAKEAAANERESTLEDRASALVGRLELEAALQANTIAQKEASILQMQQLIEKTRLKLERLVIESPAHEAAINGKPIQ